MGSGLLVVSVIVTITDETNLSKCSRTIPVWTRRKEQLAVQAVSARGGIDGSGAGVVRVRGAIPVLRKNSVLFRSLTDPRDRPFA